MKRKLLLLLALMAIGLSGAWAYDFSAVAPSGQTLYYNITGGNAVVTSLNSNLTGALVIPASVTYNGTTYSVTSIRYNAFFDCSGLTSVTIPNSVTSIESSAFYGCSGLTSVTIPNSVTTIGRSAFFGCSNVDTLYYNARNLTTTSEWGNSSSPYYNIYGFLPMTLKHLVIGDSVQTLPDYVFLSQDSLTSVTIPNSVTSIGNYAFSGCYRLTSVTIPNSVTSIGERAFYNCRGLTSVTIPNSVTTIGEGAFYYCRGLTSVTIPNSVTSIGDYAFQYCSSLTSVTIGNSVTSIGDNAFQYCSSLTSVTIPNSVTSIGDYAFQYCSSLTSVTIGNSVTSIGDNAFQYCSSLTSVTIGNSVTTIGYTAFSGCSNVDTLYYNARNLTTTWEWYSSPSYGFRSMGLNHLVIGDSVQTLPAGVFYGQSSLTSVTIPNSVTSIGVRAFYNCSSLTSVTMEGATPPTLGSDVFYGNASNRKIYVPCGAYETYYNATNGWSTYCSALSDPIVDIDVTVNAESGKGSASIIPLRGQNVRCDSTIVVTATPNYGYHFDHWSTGSTQVEDTFAIEDGSIITAYFANNQYTINVVSDNMDMGNVFGADTIEYLDSVTISAVANYGYRFSRWNDGSTDNPHTIQVIGDDTYTAIFVLDMFSLSVSSIDTIMGSATYSVGRTDGVIVGTGTSGNYNAPFNNYYKNSMNESLYLASEIGASGLIDTLWYYCTSANTHNYTTLNIYMGTTSATSLSSGWVGLNDLQLVYSATNGSIATNTGWEPYKLDTPFDYNGTENLIIVVCRQATNYTQSKYQYTSTNNMCRYRQSDDNSNYGLISNTTAGNTSSERANIKLSMAVLAYTAPVTLVATANYGYHFDHWNDGDTTNPRVIVMDSNKTFVAHFDYNQYTITGTSANAVMGSVEGTATQNYLTNITLSATPNYGYHFTQWNDGSTVNPRVVQVDDNTTYTAYFDYNQYQLTVASANTVQGSCSGSGIYNYLSNRTISATANYGYHFARWSDGNTDNPRIIQLTQDTLFTAEFAKNQYAVNVVSSDTVRGYVTGSDTIDYLDSITISAVANYGYHFTRWNDNDTHSVHTVQVTQNKTYTAYFDFNQYQLTAASADTVQGTCSGSGAYSYLANRTIQATANYGYHFTQWSDGNTDNPRTIQLTQDTIFTAEFAKNQYEITAVSDDESLGMVSGGGIFDYLDTVILTATTIAEHHHFVRWSDGNRENPRQYVVTEDKTLTAYFAVDTHSVAVVSNDPTRGMVTSSGSEFEYLSPCTVTATSYTGFVFTGWSNGVTANPYTFAVQSDVELTAIFVSEDELMFTITVETDNPTMGSVSGGGMAMSGGEVTIHAVANEGYHFVRWNDNDTNADRTVIVTEDATYTAYFAADQTEGIDEVEQIPTIVVRGNSIAVGNAQGQKLSIYDITGRMIVREQAVEGKAYTMPNTGVYMVQVGSHPAEKVVVVR